MPKPEETDQQVTEPETNDNPDGEVTEPEDAETDDTAEPDAEPKPPPVQHEFDKDRQQDQIALANANKENARLRDDLAAKSDAPAKEDGDDDAIPDDPIDRIDRLEKRNTEDQQSRQKLRDEVKDLQSQRQTAMVSARYTKHMANMEAAYGAEHTNAAIAWAQDESRRRGYTLEDEKNVPDVEHACDLLEMGYLRVTRSAATPAPAGGKAKRSPRADTSQTGSATTDKPFNGSMEDVIEDMKKQGKLKSYVLDE